MRSQARIVIALILLNCAQLVCAQVRLHGKVSDSSGESLEALITVFDAGKIVSHTMADESGEFLLEFTTTSDSITIRASMLGYTTLNKKIATSSSELNFILLGGGNTLKEVEVVPDKITERGDTINYLVASFKDEGDRVIGDVIKKMPGLEVSETGRISFNGKEVKNFYVEDMDLLQGRYGIATNNVSANAVASVQVYQNHQPIRALKDIAPSEDITINLKLKESAKGTWILTALGGGGYKPALWEAELIAMYFGQKVQTMASYKGNNCGVDVNSELHTMTNDNLPVFTNKSPLSVSTPSSPGISTRRYIINKSNAINLNQLVKTDSLTTLTFNVNYYYDQLRKNGEVISQQYEPVSGKYRSIFKELNACNYINSLSSRMNLKKNGNSLYLDNSLNINANWNHDIGTAITSSSFTSGKTIVDQRLDNPTFEITDRLSFIKNSGKHSWETYLSGGWNHKPLSLSVTGDMNEYSQTGNLIQNYTTDAAIAHFYTSRSVPINKVRLYTGIYADFNLENVKSELDGVQFTDKDLTQNDFTYGKLDVGVQPRISYLNRQFYLELILPVYYNLQWLNDRIDKSRNKGWNYIGFRPQIHITYSMGRNWLSFDVNYNRIRDNSQRAARGMVMTDYLSFKRSEIESTIIDESWLTSLSYYFSNPFRQIFGNASLSWNQFRHNNISSYEYDGLSTVIITMPLRNVSNRYSILSNLNKGLGFWGTTLKLGISASLYKGNSLINNSLFAFNTKRWGASLVASSNPAEWMGVALALAYGENRSETEGIEVSSPWVRTWTGRADVNFYPLKNLILNVSAENNYTNLTSGDKNVWFGDAKITYKHGRFEWNIAFNNIFNFKSFTKVSYTAMDIYTNTYRLRERNIMLTVRINIL